MINTDSKHQDIDYMTDLKPKIKDKARSIKLQIGIFGVAVIFFLISNFTIGSQFLPLLNITSILAVAAAGQTIVFLLGGIDLSVASVITGASVLTCTLFKANIPFVLIVLLVLLASVGFGLLNGLGITKLRIPPLVMTIASGNILLGIILITTNGRPNSADSEILTTIVTGKLFGLISGSIIILIVVAVFLTWLFSKTTFGRKLYMLGSNETVAKLSGVKTENVTIKAYALCALFSGLTGLMLLGYTGTSSLTVGNSYLLPSIAAVLLGGTSPLGGKGNYFGTILGAFLLTNIISLLTVMQISQAIRQILEGMIMLFFIIVNNSKFFGKR